MDKITLRHADEMLETIALLYVGADKMQQKVYGMIQPLVDILHPNSVGARTIYALWKNDDHLTVHFHYSVYESSVESSVDIPFEVWYAEDPMQAALDFMSDQPACGASKEERIATICAKLQALNQELRKLEDDDY